MKDEYSDDKFIVIIAQENAKENHDFGLPERWTIIKQIVEDFVSHWTSKL